MPDLFPENPPPMPPAPPCDDECCQSGCDPCVFDRYAAELERYRTALKSWEERSTAGIPPSRPE